MKKLLAPILIAAVFFVLSFNSVSAVCTWTISQDREIDGQTTTCFENGANSCLEHHNSNNSRTLTVRVEGIELDGELVERQAGNFNEVGLEINQHTVGGEPDVRTRIDPNTPGLAIFHQMPGLTDNTPSSRFTFTVVVRQLGNGGNYTYVEADQNCQYTISTRQECPTNSCITESTEVASDGERINTPFHLCEQLPAGTSARADCESCAGGADGQEGIWTAIGCINRAPSAILQTLLATGLTIAGGVALLMILGAGFIFSTSAGDPKKLDQAKELITSAIVGLIFIIFSVALLQFVGVTVLRIPGFGG